MHAIKQAALAAAALALLVGCTPNPNAPGPAPSTQAAQPPVPKMEAIATKTPTTEPTHTVAAAGFPTLPALVRYECREATLEEGRRVQRVYVAGTTALAAVDMGEGWALIAGRDYGGNPLLVISKGARFAEAGSSWNGIYASYPMAFAGYQEAMRAALGCI